MIFYDTSVLIAASIQTHSRHRESAALLPHTDSDQAAISVHCLSEFYSVSTRLPLPIRLPVEAALGIVEQVQAAMEIVTLSASEQIAVIRRLAAANLRGGLIYDALILECARKVGATQIYTLNGRHFRMIAPDLAGRIVEPESSS